MATTRDARTARISIEELAGLPTVLFPKASWGGDRVAFYWDRTGRFELYVLDLRTREVTRLTDGQAPRHLRAGFAWTRDDAAIVFARDRDGDEQHDLFRLDVRTRDVTRLNDDPRSQEIVVEVSPDNRFASVQSNREGQLSLFTLDLVAREWRRLTAFPAPASGGRWSPDGRWLAAVSNESSDLKNLDGYLVRADGSEVRKVLSVREGSEDVVAAWHPDGRRLAVTSDASGVHRAGILDLDAGEVRWLGEEGVEEHAVGFSRDGRWLAALRNRESSLRPVVYDVASGRERALDLPDDLSLNLTGGSPGLAFVLDDGALLLHAGTSTRRPELFLYDLATDAREVLLPAGYGSIDPSLFVPDRHVWYPSFDGRPVPALLYAPRDIQPGERLPALIHVHGGPTFQFFRGFDPFAQFLADRGYVVLCPNIRGSTGYGVEWRDLNIKDWGGDDLEDVAGGAAYLRTLDCVDPERIGIFGGSFGGFMTFIAVTRKPDLFRVGIPWIGVTDLHLLYEESMDHFKYYFRQQMGDPVADHDLWRDRSAVTHAHNLKAKLLIIHGVNDPRCPVSQARVFRQRLLDLGKREGTGPDDDFEYHEFADEGHGPSGDIQGKIRTFTLLADFVDRRL